MRYLYNILNYLNEKLKKRDVIDFFERGKIGNLGMSETKLKGRAVDRVSAHENKVGCRKSGMSKTCKGKKEGWV